MPEIAEVETVRRTLKKQILNKKIKYVKVLYPNIIEKDSLPIDLLIGQSFKEIDRMGKWLIFKLDDYCLLSHLRMEGKYFLKNETEEINKHEHIIFGLDDVELRYHDTRKFGRMVILKKGKVCSYKALTKLGIEPISDNLTKEYLFNKLNKSNLPIKTLLLDQTIISGLGNIYVNEVLFSSRINPHKKGKDISLNECDKIVKSSKIIIEEAIKMGGTTIKSYTSSLGVTGRFQQKLCVHKRENEKCKNCNSIIKKEFIDGRGTYYCPECQK